MVGMMYVWGGCLSSSGVPTVGSVVGSAAGIVRSTSGRSSGRVAAAPAGVGGVEKLGQGWGFSLDGRRPFWEGRVGAEASWVVGGVAYRALKYLVCSSCTVGHRGEGGFLDEGAPFEKGDMVLSGGVDVDVPSWVGFALSRTYVLFPNEVEAADCHGIVKIS